MPAEFIGPRGEEPTAIILLNELRIKLLFKYSFLYHTLMQLSVLSDKVSQYNE